VSGVENVEEVKCANTIELVQPVKNVEEELSVNITENVGLVKYVIHMVI